MEDVIESTVRALPWRVSLKVTLDSGIVLTGPLLLRGGRSFAVNDPRRRQAVPYASVTALEIRR